MRTTAVFGPGTLYLAAGAPVKRVAGRAPPASEVPSTVQLVYPLPSAASKAYVYTMLGAKAVAEAVKLTAVSITVAMAVEGVRAAAGATCR